MASFVARKPFRFEGRWVARGEILDLSDYDSRAIQRMMRQGVIDVSAGAAKVDTPWVYNAAEDTIIPADTADSWIVGSNQKAQDPTDTTKDIRSFFDKIKGAFRAGGATGTQWDDANVGAQSSAFGLDNVASGTSSHAEGSGTTASGLKTHAEGDGTTASGEDAHAEGLWTSAEKIASHAEGRLSKSRGNWAHAEGDTTDAVGTGSHTEGKSTITSMSYAHAEGDGTTASGQAAHAEGSLSTASGANAHAEGYNTKASGPTTHAEGHTTEATSYYAHAGGERAVASRVGQHARSSGQFAAPGDAQASHMVLRQTTTDATAGILMAFGSTAYFAAPDTNVWTLLASRAHKVRIEAVARRTDVDGEVAGFTWEGVVARGATGSPRIVGTPVTSGWSDTAAAGWTLTVSINETDAANPYLAVTGTGEAGKTIRWVASLDVTEVG